MGFKGWTGDRINEEIRKGKTVVGMDNYTKPMPAGWTHIKSTLELHGLEFSNEKRVSKKRRFKFDFYVPTLNLGIEYEGLGRGNDKSKMGGHQTPTGFTNNCTKYNLACLEGINLLRYTPINFREFSEDIKIAIEKFKK